MKSFYIVLYYVPLEMAHIIQYLKFFTTKHFVFFLKWTHSIPFASERQDKSGIKLLIKLAINMMGKLASNFIYGINLEESWPLCSVLGTKPLVPERTDKLLPQIVSCSQTLAKPRKISSTRILFREWQERIPRF